MEKDDFFFHDYQMYLLNRKDNTKILFDISHLRDRFFDLFRDLEEVVSPYELERFDQNLKEAERDYEKLVQEVEDMQKKQDVVDDEIDVVDDEREEVLEKRDTKEETISEQKSISTSTFQEYDEFMDQAMDVADTLEYHKKNIQKYIGLIDQIQAREVTVYRSLMVHHTTMLATRFVQRSIESKVLSAVLPKKIAQLYLAVQLVNDAKNIAMNDPLTITRKEIDVSYYDELIREQGNVKDYRQMLVSTLNGVSSLKEKYKDSCDGFPNSYLYQENLKKLDELEDMLVREAVQLEEVVSSYDETIDYQDQKIKVLKDL